MTSPIKSWEMSNNTENFRSAVVNEPRIFGGAYGIHTPQGTVPALPALPPRPYAQSYGMGGANTYGSSMYGGSSMFGGGLGGYGSGFGSGMYGASSYGSGMYGGAGMGYGGYGGGGYGGAYNRFGGGPNPMDPESRFIQIAEESSRPAFQSIESLVSAIGNIAAMLDSTFFAITSSFRAILGVAANFGRLRGVFAQFWSTFAIFRGMTWLYRKIMYFLKMSNVDPSTALMGEAFAAAQGVPSSPDGPNKKSNAWPILVFLGFIFTAPYLIMKLLGTVSTTALEETRYPRTWVNPIKAQVKHTFQASNPQELTMRQGQTIYIAPREIQNTQQLLNTGWVLATIDNQTSGIIPLNYIQGPQQVRQNVDATTPATEPKDSSEAATLGEPMMPEKPIAEPRICDIPTDFDANNTQLI